MLHETYRHCTICHRSRCTNCDGNGDSWICELSVCRLCKAERAGAGDLLRNLEQRLGRLTLQALEDGAVNEAARKGTTAVHKRGIASYKEHAGSVGIDEPFPASQAQLAHYAVWATFTRAFPLDTSTVKIYLTGVSLWHQQAAEATGIKLENPRHGAHLCRVLAALEKLYKRSPLAMVPFTADLFAKVLHAGFLENVMGVRHNELLFVLLAAGPFRPNLAVNIRVEYEVMLRGDHFSVEFSDDSEIWVERGRGDDGICVYVEKDKNVTKLNRRVATLPETFFGLNLIELLESYLLEVRPPSGGRLLACPKDLKKRAPDNTVMYLPPGVHNLCNAGAYSASCDAVKRAVGRAAKEFGLILEPSIKYGGGTPRKTTADCLYAVGHTKKMVADIGGWALREDAADLYLRANPRTRRKTMAKLMADLVGCGQLTGEARDAALALRRRHRKAATQGPVVARHDPSADWFRDDNRWRRVV